jgi:hypothetical protein
MAVVRNAINSCPYYDWLADLVFGWLFATKAQKVVSKMVALKVQKEGAANLFQFALKWLLSSKLGPIVFSSPWPAPPRRLRLLQTLLRPPKFLFYYKGVSFV